MLVPEGLFKGLSNSFPKAAAMSSVITWLILSALVAVWVTGGSWSFWPIFGKMQE